jgi:hypothetical protein
MSATSRRYGRPYYCFFCRHNFCPAFFLVRFDGTGLKIGSRREDRRSLRSLHEALGDDPEHPMRRSRSRSFLWDITAAVLSCRPRSFTCYRYVCSGDLHCLIRLGPGHSRSTICELATFKTARRGPSHRVGADSLSLADPHPFHVASV